MAVKVLVTGASRGIGRAVALALAQRGDALALAARDTTALAAVAREAGGAKTFALDLAQTARLPSLVDDAAAALGGLDALVNCAGVVRYAAALELSEADLAAQHAVNFVAPLTAAYAATKAALISLTRSLALELAPHQIRVNAVAPGVIDTEMVRVARPGSQHASVDAELEALRSAHPIGRLGTPDDVAFAVLYLLDATFVTGSVLVVDGGLTLSG